MSRHAQLVVALIWHHQSPGYVEGPARSQSRGESECECACKDRRCDRSREHASQRDLISGSGGRSWLPRWQVTLWAIRPTTSATHACCSSSSIDSLPIIESARSPSGIIDSRLSTRATRPLIIDRRIDVRTGHLRLAAFSPIQRSNRGLDRCTLFKFKFKF